MESFSFFPFPLCICKLDSYYFFFFFPKGELESAISDLEESNLKLATLKAERDATKGTFFPVLNLGNKPVPGDRARDKQKILQEMQSALKELLVSFSFSPCSFLHVSLNLEKYTY